MEATLLNPVQVALRGGSLSPEQGCPVRRAGHRSLLVPHNRSADAGIPTSALTPEPLL